MTMTERLVELDTTQFTTGLKNRLTGFGNKALAAAGNYRALGAQNVRLTANDLYRKWRQYLGSTGKQGTNVDLANYIGRYWPDLLPTLQQSFPNQLPAAAAPSPGPAAPSPPVPPDQTEPSVPDFSQIRQQWKGQRPASQASTQAPDQQVFTDALSALTRLGYRRTEAEPVVRRAMAGGNADLQSVLHNSLKNLAPTRESRRKNGRLVEADPSLSIPPQPSIMTQPRQGLPGTPLTTQNVAGPVPPDFLTRQQNPANPAAPIVLNRAQIDRIFVAVAQNLIDSGRARVDADNTAMQMKPEQQPRSAAGQAYAQTSGFGGASAQQALQTPITRDVLNQAATKLGVQISQAEKTKVDNILAAHNGRMPMLALITQLGGQMSQEMLQVLYAI
jgi:hypothetical protein